MKTTRSKAPLRILPGILLAGALGLVLVDAAAHSTTSSGPDRYIGATKCKNCHRSDTTGNQYGVWQEARHSHAFETLGTPQALEIAAERGIADPQKADECMRCHRTGHGLPDDQFKRGFDVNAGVQCETCHGPGEAHMKLRMRAAAAGDTTSVEPGEMIASPAVETCRTCHNAESPTYKHFCFACRTSKIRHLNPARRTAEEIEAMQAAAKEACDCESACGAEACRHQQ